MAKLLAIVLGLLLWWPLVPEAASLAQAVHAVGWSEQTPLESSELHEAEDFAGEDTTADSACSCAPAHLLEHHGWMRIDIPAHECACGRPGHEQFQRQRGPPSA
jgi:hypothetical protein